MNDSAENWLERAAAIEADLQHRGLIVEGGFELWWYLKLLCGMPPEWREEFRESWFTASVHLFEAMRQMMSGRAEATSADLDHVTALMAELENFRQRMLATQQ